MVMISYDIPDLDWLERTLKCVSRALCLGAFVLFVTRGTAVLSAEGFDLVTIPAGTARLGDAQGDNNETPRVVRIGSFKIMRHEVTNRQFAAFVSATGHVTDPEKGGKAFVWTKRWRLVAGAAWRRPHGPRSTVDGLDEHPVLQVSARDADAFCAHYGLRLPGGDEWEYAARGSDGRRYPWGNDVPGAGADRRANFGTIACCAADDADGYVRTAPVGSYEQGRSPFGVLDMAGNVWEWTASRFPGKPAQRSLRGGGWGNNPYCLRAAYRHGNPPDIGLDMVGFRCAGDVQ